MSEILDVVVIGAGPGGYVAALRSAQLGLKTAVIDAWQGRSGEASPGGTCLNVGCIPSKQLLEASEHFERIHHQYADEGLVVDGARMDVPKLIRRKESVVEQLCSGVLYLLKKNRIPFHHGKARLKGEGAGGLQVEVAGFDGSTTVLATRHVIIATGSTPAAVSGVKVDNAHILDNAGALGLTEAPASMAVIGAGVIGLELGSVWRRLGSEVTLFAPRPSFLAAADTEIATAARAAFEKQGLKIQTDTRVSSAVVKKGKVHLVCDVAGVREERVVDKLLVAAGRRPATEALGLETVGLVTDERGFIPVDAVCQTAHPAVYAIGDCVRGPMLAHKASEEGVMAAERIAGQKTQMHYDLVPSVIYTSPEIAWVGQTEQQLQAAHIPYRAGSFPFRSLGRALTIGATAGMVKVLAHAETDRVLGVHILGEHASELIAEAATVMAFSGSAEDISRICHAHPTLSEAVHEAALAALGRPLHK